MLGLSFGASAPVIAGFTEDASASVISAADTSWENKIPATKRNTK